MATMRLTLPTGRTPIASRSTRAAPDTIIAPTYTGVAVSGRPTEYDFTLTGIADGSYEFVLTDPSAHFVAKITSGVADVADYWWQLDTVDDVAELATGLAVTVTLNPTLGFIEERISQGTTINLGLSEEDVQVDIVVLDANGDAVDVELKTLELVIDRRKGQDKVVIDDGDMVKDANVATVTIPASVTDVVNQYKFTLWDITTARFELFSGVVDVHYASAVEVVP